MRRASWLCAVLFAVLGSTCFASTSVPLQTVVQYVSGCQSVMGVRVMTGVIEWEHREAPWPWALGVNIDTRHHASYEFASFSDAVAGASWLYSRGFHNMDVGLSQLNTGNFATYGLLKSDGQPQFDRAFDPCVNVRDGAMLLRGDYDRAVRRFGMGPYALFAAVRAYHTGSLDYGDGYARSVWDVAASLPSWVGSTNVGETKK